MRPFAVLRRAGESDSAPVVTLSAIGSDAPLYWLVNGRVVNQTTRHQSFRYAFEDAGAYDITALDSSGNYDNLSVKVIR